MSKVEFSLNIGDLETKLKNAIPAARQEVKKELYQFGNEIMSVSQERVPVDTGALMSSGRVELPVENGTEVSVTLGYGSLSVGYAWHVHENMSQTVRWQRPGSGPKFLEGPLKEVQDQLPARVAAAVMRGFKGK
jgi:hypothetical protein